MRCGSFMFKFLDKVCVLLGFECVEWLFLSFVVLLMMNLLLLN